MRKSAQDLRSVVGLTHYAFLACMRIAQCRALLCVNVTTIGDLLKQRRRALGHNQAAAGEVLGVTGPTVSRWETGQATPESDQIDALVAYLGTSEPVVLTAIHQQASASEQDERVVRMLVEVLAGQDDIRRRQDELERLLRGNRQAEPLADD